MQKIIKIQRNKNPSCVPSPETLQASFYLHSLSFVVKWKSKSQNVLSSIYIRIRTYCLNEVIAFLHSHRQPLSDVAVPIFQYSSSHRCCQTCDSVHGSVYFIGGRMKDEDCDQKNISNFHFIRLILGLQISH